MDFWTDLGQDTSDNDLCCWRVLVACPTRTIWSTRPFTNYSGITKFIVNTVDGRNPANQLRLVVFPIIHRVSYIPGAGFQPSTVVWSLVSFSQQYIQKTYIEIRSLKKKSSPLNFGFPGNLIFQPLIFRVVKDRHSSRDVPLQKKHQPIGSTYG